MSSPPPESDDVRHLRSAVDYAASSAFLDRMTRAINLLRAGLDLVPHLPCTSMYANDFACRACLGRSYRELRAATVLLFSGYEDEVRKLLRSTYEAGGLARVIAHEPEMAERWLRKQEWFPDGKVRELLRAAGTDDSRVDLLSKGYRQMSAWSHPTAISSVHLFEHDSTAMKLDTTFNRDAFDVGAAEIAATALFCCFALRNAAVSEQAIDPQWRKALYELAREFYDSDMPHLDRNWAEEQQRFDAVRGRVQEVERLRSHLAEDDLSWDNLKKLTADDVDHTP